MYAYDELGQRAREYQAHAGAVDTNVTPYVWYAFSAEATNGVFQSRRMASVRYPDGRLVHYGYGDAGSPNDLLSRVKTISDDSTNTPGTAGQMLTRYAYCGVGRIVQEEYPQPGVKLDYAGDTARIYAGFDRFGRIVDQNWRMAGTNSADRFLYGYDFNSSRIYRKNVLAAAALTPKDYAYATMVAEALKARLPAGLTITGDTLLS